MLNASGVRTYDCACPALVTLRNVCLLASQAAHRVMHWVQGELFSLKHAQEDQLEHYFASLKRPYQGTPTFKDLVVAAQVHHTRQKNKVANAANLQQHTKLQHWGGLPRSDVVELSNRSLDTACQFVSALMVQVPASQLQADLVEWWQRDGEQLLFRSNPEEENGEKDASAEFVVGDESDGDSEEDSDPVVNLDEDDAASAAVEHAEVHMAAAREIDDLNQKLQDTAKVNLEERFGMVTHDLQESQILPDPCEGNDPNDRIILRPDRTLGGLLQSADVASESDGRLQEHGRHGDGELAAVDRGWKLMPIIMKFMVQARHAEKALSLTQITGVSQGLNTWNAMQHEVSLARRAYIANTARQSRSALRMNFQRRVQHQLGQQLAEQATTDHRDHVQVVKNFIPPCITDSRGVRRYQVLVIRLHRSDSVKLALVLDVFRGMKKGEKRFGSRRAYTISFEVCNHSVLTDGLTFPFSMADIEIVRNCC